MGDPNDVGAPITSSVVVVTQPRAKHFSGDPCRLRVHLTVEGGPDINVSHDPGAGRRHDAMRVAVRDTFRIVRRRLEDLCGEENPFRSDVEGRADRLKVVTSKYKPDYLR